MNAKRNDSGGEEQAAPPPQSGTPDKPAPKAPAAPRRSGKGYFWLILVLLAGGAAFLLYRYPAIWQKLPFFNTAQQAPAAPLPPCRQFLHAQG